MPRFFYSSSKLPSAALRLGVKDDRARRIVEAAELRRITEVRVRKFREGVRPVDRIRDGGGVRGSVAERYRQSGEKGFRFHDGSLGLGVGLVGFDEQLKVYPYVVGDDVELRPAAFSDGEIGAPDDELIFE